MRRIKPIFFDLNTCPQCPIATQNLHGNIVGKKTTLTQKRFDLVFKKLLGLRADDGDGDQAEGPCAFHQMPPDSTVMRSARSAGHVELYTDRTDPSAFSVFLHAVR